MREKRTRYAVGEAGLRGRPDALQNDQERLFAEQAVAAGYEVVRRGWPDFLLIRDGRLCAVEVKRQGTRGMGYEQWRVLTALAAAGIDCFRWSPAGGFRRITPGMPFPSRGG